MRTVCKAVWLLSAALSSGCSGATVFARYPQKIAPYLASVEAGRPVAATKILRSESEGRDRVLYRMERGRLAQLAGDTVQSRGDFEGAIEAIRKNDERALVSASAAGGELESWLLNDSARPYEAEGYERVMVHHLQALNFLVAGDLEGAGVEVRRANFEQEQARKRYQAEIDRANRAAGENRVPFGAVTRVERDFREMDQAANQVVNSYQNAYTFYLSGCVYEALRQPNDAYIDYKKALEIFPGNRVLRRDLLRLARALGMQEDLDEFTSRFGEDAAAPPAAEPGGGQLVVLLEDGFVPAKQEVKFPVPAPGGGLIAVAFPIYRYPWLPPAPLTVVEGERRLGRTEPIAYVDAMAVRALKEKIPAIIIRHLIRSAGKAVAARQAQDQLGPLGGLAVSVWNVVSENADLRSWLGLPRDAQILRVALPAGMHSLSLGTAPEAGGTRLEVPIREGGITLVHVVRAGRTIYARSVVMGERGGPVAKGFGQ